MLNRCHRPYGSPPAEQDALLANQTSLGLKPRIPVDDHLSISILTDLANIRQLMINESVVEMGCAELA